MMMMMMMMMVMIDDNGGDNGEMVQPASQDPPQQHFLQHTVKLLGKSLGMRLHMAVTTIMTMRASWSKCGRVACRHVDCIAGVGVPA